MLGCEFSCNPAALFPDLIGADPLLASWDEFVAAGEMNADGVSYVCDSRFPAGREELERVFYRSFIQPVAQDELAGLIYREFAVVLPLRKKQLTNPAVTLFLKACSDWVESGFGAVEIEHSFEAERDGATLRGRGNLRAKVR